MYSDVQGPELMKTYRTMSYTAATVFAEVHSAKYMADVLTETYAIRLGGTGRYPILLQGSSTT